MNSLKLLFVLLLVGLFACSKEEPLRITPPDHTNPDVQAAALSSSMTDFSQDLLEKVLEEEPDENVVISPLSVAAALYMTYNGANGSTRSAMSQTLALNDMTVDTLNAAYEALSHLLQSTSGNTELHLANAVFWDENRITPSADFLNPMETHYQAETVAADFENNPTEVLNRINDWVNDKTEGRIEKILEELNPEEVMFLVNALYFTGDWAQPFAAELTADRDFTLANGNTIQAPTMFQDDEFRFLRGDEFSAVELDFDHTDYAMQFVLPGTKQNISEWLNQERLISINKSLSDQATLGRVMIMLPKFEINYKIQLNEVLQSLGMEIAFNPGSADFSNLGSLAYGNAYLSRVEHKTFLKIDEKGAEGAAVTSVGIGTTSAAPTIHFDRPFLIHLLHKPSGTTVFAGVIQDPLATH